MKQLTIKYILLALLSFTLCTCKKKTTIDVNVYNFALDEKVPGATIVLVQRKEDGLFTDGASCNEIATAISDADGNCSFDKEKLSTNKKYTYFLGIKEAYGAAGAYPCSGKTSGFVQVGESQNQGLNADIFDGFFRIQYNNLLSPSQPGDSLIVGLSTIEYVNPKGGVVQGGGGVFSAFPNYNIDSPPNNPDVIVLPSIKTKAQQLLRFVRKRKLGVISVKIDTVKVYPNTTTTIEINW